MRESWVSYKGENGQEKARRGNQIFVQNTIQKKHGTLTFFISGKYKECEKLIWYIIYLNPRRKQSEVAQNYFTIDL